MNVILSGTRWWLLGLLSSLSSANAAELLTVDYQSFQGGSAFGHYSLPQSLLKITIPITRVKYVPGQFAKYSSQYALPTRLNDEVFSGLGKVCVRGADQTADVYIVGTPKMELMSIADGSKEYIVTSPHALSEKDKTALKSALPAKPSTIPLSVVFAFTAEPKEIPKPGRSDAASDLELATSTEAANGVTANVVVNRLRLLQAKRDKLLTNSPMQLSGQQAGDALAAIQNEIESLSIKFTGNVQIERYTFFTDWTPATSDVDGKQVVKSLFKLDTCHGIHELTDGASVDGISPDALAESEKADSVSLRDIRILASLPLEPQSTKEVTISTKVKYGLRYRIPFVSNLILYDGGNEIVRVSLPLPQFGSVGDLETQQIVQKDGKFAFRIDEGGALVSNQ